MADKDKNTTGKMYSDRELSIIKHVLGNDDTLRAIQRAMLGFELTKADISTLDKFDEDTIKVISKAFNPKVTDKAPYGQNFDLLMTMKLEERKEDEVERVIETRLKLIELIEKGIERIKNRKREAVSGIADFDTDRKVDRAFIEELMARNTLINHTDIVINTLKILASQDSIEAIKEKVTKNSSK